MTEQQNDLPSAAAQAAHRAFHAAWGGPEVSLNLYADSPLWEPIADAVRAVVAAEEQERTRKSLGRAWSAFLDLLMDTTLDDGTPMIDVVLAHNPELRTRLTVAIYKPHGLDRVADHG